LKKSIFLKTAKISGIENVYPRCERPLQGFLTQSFSDHFSGSARGLGRRLVITAAEIVRAGQQRRKFL
jgi:hypothetical protein